MEVGLAKDWVLTLWAVGITWCLGVEAEPEMRVWVQMVYWGGDPQKARINE